MGRPELARAKKEAYAEEYQRRGSEAGWHFLTGTQPNIDRLTQTVGFRYAWDAKFQQYAHASGLIILTPQGTTARYFYGIAYAPSLGLPLRVAMTETPMNRDEVQELGSRLATIVEASPEAIIGSTLDGLVTDWNPAAERIYGYTAAEAVGRKLVVVPTDTVYGVAADAFSPPGVAALLAAKGRGRDMLS